MADLERSALLAVLDSLPVGVGVFEPRHRGDEIEDLVWRYINPALRSAIDLPGDLIGHGLAERIPEHRTSGLLDRYLEVYRTGVELRTRIDFQAEAAAGVFDVVARRLGDLLLVQSVDVTKAVRAEAAQRAAQERVTETLERINDAVYSLDRDWCFTFVNDAAGRLLGWDPAELVGLYVWQTFPDAAGSEIERHYQHAVAHGKTVRFEAYYPEPLDTWYSISAYPGPEGLTVFFQDIGARRRMEDRAAGLERLESAATLAGGVAHEFNNLLMVMAGHARLIEEDLPSAHPLRQDVAAILAAAGRGAELTQQLVTFGRGQAVEPAVVDLSSALERVVPLLRQVTPPTIHLELRGADGPVLVDVDPDELERALVHLASNAVQAMPDGGSLLLEATEVHVDDAHALVDPGPAPGWYGVVSVSDTGVGMSEAVRRRAVDPFFSTKRGAGATGLGLSAVHGMAQQAGGHLVIASAPGEGTTVRIHLPRAASDRPGAGELSP